MNNKKIFSKLLIGGTLACTIIASGSFTSAATRTVDKYDAIAPMVGTWYSNPVAKVGATNGVNNNVSVGGGKTLNTSVCYGNTRITDSMSITTGSRVVLTYQTGANILRSDRLELDTPWNVLVDVQAQGSWSPDAE